MGHGWGRPNGVVPTAIDVMNKFIGKPIVGLNATSVKIGFAIHVQKVAIKVHIANMDLFAGIAHKKIGKKQIKMRIRVCCQGPPLYSYTPRWVPIREMPVGWVLDGVIWKTAELKSSSNEV